MFSSCYDLPMKKFFLILLAVVVSIIVSAITYMIIVGKDIPPPDFSDLVIERLDIPDEENAYTYFLAAKI